MPVIRFDQFTFHGTREDWEKRPEEWRRAFIADARANTKAHHTTRIVDRAGEVLVEG